MHRFTCIEGVELVKKFEGFKPEPYICAGGYLTIGYGHKLLPSDRIGNKITIEKAEHLLRQDLIRTERAVLKYIEVVLNDFQFAALVSFTFNIGAAALQRSILRQKLNYGLYCDAAKEFLRWTYAGGKRVKGLATRRKIETMLFRGELHK